MSRALAVGNPVSGVLESAVFDVPRRAASLLSVYSVQTSGHAGQQYAASARRPSAAQWLLGMHMLTSTKTNLTAVELMWRPSVCCRMAWRRKHELTQAMTDYREPWRLGGFLEVDDAWLGGKHKGGSGRGGGPEKEKKFVAAVQANESLQWRRLP